MTITMCIVKKMSGGEPVCIDDFEQHAKQFLPKRYWYYFSKGANALVSLQESKNAFQRLRLRPRVLRDVSTIDTATTILGEKIEFPVCVSPTALHKLAHPDGEVATARASSSAGTCMVLSTWATSTIEEVARSSPRGLKWYHMYFLPDEKENISRIHRAENEGYKAIVLTIDAPYRGRNYSVVRHMSEDTYLPNHLSLPNLDSLMKVWRSDTGTPEEKMAPIYGTGKLYTWDMIHRLR